jgi:four helix bundle protein
MDNIAEGYGRGSRLEFINALTIARGETDELKSQLYRGLAIAYFPESFFNDQYQLADRLAKKITSFINYLNKSKHRGQKFKERS